VAEAAPKGRFVVIDRAGHSAALEQPEAVNAAIRSFIAEHAALPKSAQERSSRRIKATSGTQ
jgi:hypothetical protein